MIGYWVLFGICFLVIGDGAMTDLKLLKKT
jgi:hypothetical protein